MVGKLFQSASREHRSAGRMECLPFHNLLKVLSGYVYDGNRPKPNLSQTAKNGNIGSYRTHGSIKHLSTRPYDYPKKRTTVGNLPKFENIHESTTGRRRETRQENICQRGSSYYTSNRSTPLLPGTSNPLPTFIANDNEHIESSRLVTENKGAQEDNQELLEIVNNLCSPTHEPMDDSFYDDKPLSKEIDIQQLAITDTPSQTVRIKEATLNSCSDTDNADGAEDTFNADDVRKVSPVSKQIKQELRLHIELRRYNQGQFELPDLEQTREPDKVPWLVKSNFLKDWDIS